MQAAARRSADDVVAIGLQLRRIQAHLGHGRWLKWVDDNAGFSRSTATNYIDLAAWSDWPPGPSVRLASTRGCATSDPGNST